MTIRLALVLCLVAAPVWAATPTSLDISWTAPTTNADGTPLTDLAGYRLYLSTPCPSLQYAPVGLTPAVAVTGLMPATTYTARITAVDTSGNESACSTTATGATLAATTAPATNLLLAFALEPPTLTLPGMPGHPTVVQTGTDATGVTFAITFTAGLGATSYSYSGGGATGGVVQGTTTALAFALRVLYPANGAASTGWVCVRSVNAAGTSLDGACNAVPVPAR